MTAADFRNAREKGDNATVDGFPYHPTLAVDASDNNSVIKAVVTLLKLDANDDGSNHGGAENIDCAAVQGGTTNQLIRVSNLPNQGSKGIPSSVLVRIFGAEGMIDRDDETSAYAHLARKQVGPPYWGRFANGRIEGWLEGMRAMETKELVGYMNEIAQQLANLHDGMMDRLSGGDDDNDATAQPALWKQLEDWYQQACESKFKTPRDVQRAQKSLGLSELRAELDWLLQETPSTDDSPVAFCHNDLLAANIMLSTNTNDKRIQLIDFEYGGINYAAFDVANHFNEFAGGPPDTPTPDYTAVLSLAQQKQFCSAYLRERNNNDVAVDDFLKHVQVFLLINHLYWGLWGVNQASTEGTAEFDYMQYAIARINQYHIAKKSYS